MNILILNGSPRLKGNSKTALLKIVNGIEKNIENKNIEFIDITTKKLSGCTNCDSCKKNGGICVTNDDSAKLIDKVYNADIIIFGTPVYWWGVSAQLKMLIDKFYSKTEQFQKQNKKVGIIAIGGAGLDDSEYGLIFEQFKCICDYLHWQIIFDEAISAWKLGAVANDTKTIKKLSELWKKL